MLNQLGTNCHYTKIYHMNQNCYLFGVKAIFCCYPIHLLDAFCFVFYLLPRREKEKTTVWKNKMRKEEEEQGIHTSFPFASDQIYLCCANKTLDFLIPLMATHIRTPTLRFVPFFSTFLSSQICNIIRCVCVSECEPTFVFIQRCCNSSSSNSFASVQNLCCVDAVEARVLR